MNEFHETYETVGRDGAFDWGNMKLLKAIAYKLDEISNELYKLLDWGNMKLLKAIAYKLDEISKRLKND